MNRVIVKSVHGALTDTYAMVSIQYSHTGGVGVKFAEHFYSRDPLPPRFPCCTILTKYNPQYKNLSTKLAELLAIFYNS